MEFEAGIVYIGRAGAIGCVDNMERVDGMTRDIGGGTGRDIGGKGRDIGGKGRDCLLYTSDAADE